MANIERLRPKRDVQIELVPSLTRVVRSPKYRIYHVRGSPSHHQPTRSRPGAGWENQQPVSSHLTHGMAPEANNDVNGFMNEFPRQPDPSFRGSNNSQEPVEVLPKSNHEATSRMKRTACVICRKRKLKCDGKKPKCATCARLGHNCAYDEARKLGGTKRGYVLELEARLGCGMIPRRVRTIN